MIYKNILIIIMLMTVMCSQSFCETNFERVYINGDSTGVFDIEIDTLGEVYVSHNTQGILTFIDDVWVSLDKDIAVDINFDNENNLWVLENGCFKKYMNGTFKEYDCDKDNYDFAHFDISEDNIIWAATYMKNSGIHKIDFNTNTITSYTLDDGLGCLWSSFIKTSSDGHVWVCHTTFGSSDDTAHYGVSHFDGKNWEIYNIDNGLPDEEICAIEVFSSDEVYLASRKGIVKYNGVELESFWSYNTEALARGADGALWAAIHEGGNQYYIKSLNGKIFKYDRYDQFTPKKVVVDKNNNVWSYYGSLYKTNLEIPHAVSINPMPIAIEEMYTTPNPFNFSTTITYTLTEQSQVMLRIFNIQGQTVSKLVDKTVSQGTHSLIFDGTGLSSGMYFLHLTAGNTLLTRKITLLK